MLALRGRIGRLEKTYGGDGEPRTVIIFASTRYEESRSQGAGKGLLIRLSVPDHDTSWRTTMFRPR